MGSTASFDNHGLQRSANDGLYQSFFDDHPDAAYIFDAYGQMIDANPACIRMSGYSLDAIRKLRFDELIPLGQDQSSAWMLNRLVDGESIQFDTTMTHRDGHAILLSVTHTPIVRDGTTVGIIGVAKDVTEQKRTEQRLREREQRYESLKRYHPNGICSFDLHGHVTGANPAFERMTGYSLRELQEMDALEALVQGADRATVLRKVSLGFVSHELETKMRHKDGHEIRVRLTTVPIVVDGETIGMHVAVEDVTEQRDNEQALLETERLFHTISENAHDIISYSTADGICRYVSPSVKRLLGYDPSEMIGHTSTQFYHPEDMDYVKSVGQRVLRGEDLDRLVCRVRCKSGNYKWFETSFKVVRDGEGQVVQVVGVGRDVSEQMRLQESLEHAVRIAGLGHWDWNIADDGLTMSSQMYELIGMETQREPLSVSVFMGVIHPEDVLLLQQSIQRSLQLGMPFDRLFRIVRRDQSIRWVHSQGEVLSDENGTAVRLIGTCQDITALKTVELQLKQSIDRYRHLLENLHDAVGIVEDGKWVYMNHTGLSLFGAETDGDVMDMPYPQFIDAEDLPAFEEALESLIAGDQAPLLEQRWVRLNGERFFAEIRGMQFQNAMVQVMIRDVTDLKQAEVRLRNAEKLSAIGQLAAGIAHEIRNPLTSLKGFTQMLQEKSIGINRRYFEIMRGELERIELILTEMLILAKPQVATFRPYHVGLILQEVIALLAPQAVMKNVVLVPDLSSYLPMVDADGNQLKQVFLNVIKNGIEAMPMGGLLNIRTDLEQGMVRIEFQDHGVGIDSDALHRLGEPFFSTKSYGTGLGLMVSQTIIQNHHGSIKFESTVGEGTTVFVRLPAVQSDAMS